MLGLLLPLVAFAATDTTPLFEQRRKELQNTPFFCAIGRDPVRDSFEAWNVQPSAQCRFNGPIDTKRDPRRLEPPFLNPNFHLVDLQKALAGEGVALELGGKFQLGGDTFAATETDEANLLDPYFHFHIHLPSWGTRFLTIQAGRAAGITALLALLRKHPESFWRNLYEPEEEIVKPLLERPNQEHGAIPLRSKCEPLAAPLPQLLVVGDLHRAADAAWTDQLVQSHDFAFAALELNADKQSSVDAFLAAGTAADEDRALDGITDNYPKDVIAPYRAMLRTLKAHRVPIVLIDCLEEYFFFPFTDTGFHGLPIAMRNRLWASRLPESWAGTALLFAGRDHFLDIPGADFQDFARARFPGLTMEFVNPAESCR